MAFRGYEGPYLDHERYHAELDTQTALLAAVARATDPDHPVPTCPKWTLADLVAHIGRGLRWAALVVDQGTFVPLDGVPVDAPDDAEGRAAWLVDSGRRLGDAVRAAGPAAPVWTWSVDRTAGFWLRRLLHDTLVHRLDAELAVGRPTPVAPDLAADSVSDWLGALATLASFDESSLSRAGLRGTGESLHLHATDGSGEWLVRRLPDGVEWEHVHGRADVAVRGSALDLLLVLTGRATPDDPGVEVLGDRAVLTSWLAEGAF